jgi:hypothetical protein
MDLTTFFDKLIAFSYSSMVSIARQREGGSRYLEVRLELKIGYTIDTPLARLGHVWVSELKSD